jgi:hypothetical protein
MDRADEDPTGDDIDIDDITGCRSSILALGHDEPARGASGRQ